MDSFLSDIETKRNASEDYEINFSKLDKNDIQSYGPTSLDEFHIADFNKQINSSIDTYMGFVDEQLDNQDDSSYLDESDSKSNLSIFEYSLGFTNTAKINTPTTKTSAQIFEDDSSVHKNFYSSGHNHSDNTSFENKLMETILNVKVMVKKLDLEKLEKTYGLELAHKQPHKLLKTKHLKKMATPRKVAKRRSSTPKRIKSNKMFECLSCHKKFSSKKSKKAHVQRGKCIPKQAAESSSTPVAENESISVSSKSSESKDTSKESHDVEDAASSRTLGDEIEMLTDRRWYDIFKDKRCIRCGKYFLKHKLMNRHLKEVCDFKSSIACPVCRFSVRNHYYNQHMLVHFPLTEENNIVHTKDLKYDAASIISLVNKMMS